MLGASDTVKSLLSANEHKVHASMSSMILLAIMAGGAIGMGDIFWAHATVGYKAAGWPAGFGNFIGGISFSVGLVLVVLFGGHLFTSSVLSGMNTTTKVLSVGTTVKYWTLVWIFNFIGSILVAYMYYRSQLPLKYDGEILKHFAALGATKTSLGAEALFIRGIFCNVFVCMAVWGAIAAKELAGKVLGIMLIIGAFVACGYEHCVANMFIITEALLSKSHYLAQTGGDMQALSHLLHVSADKLENLNLYGFLVKNLIPVTLGNIVGGLGFVGIVGLYAQKKDIEKIDL